jgi:NAD(P)-dependent dehydrogenase (short-subunit alcohol dehydrogenase family)/uncharacterized OB-fold protein
MIEPIAKPHRKNPLQRTRLPTSPPRARSRASHGFTRAAAEGRFMLQCCGDCGTFCYPARDACPACLSADLVFADAPRRGTLLSETTLHIPADVHFRERAPWRIGLVAMECGPRLVTHLHADCEEGRPVVMSFQLDKSGQAVAFAHPERETPNMADDRQWREMTADPKFRRILVTNGRSIVGQETVAALKAAGASIVFVGVAEPWKPFRGEDALRALEGIEIVPLDIGDEKSVADLAADIGGKVDILVNTTEHVRAGGLLDRQGTSVVRDEIDQSYLGFVHLAQAFGPAMRMRGSDGVNSAAAWVNILSVYALANWPVFGAYSASQAACLSLSHSLRAELRPGGVKVVNVFTGPLDIEWFQTVPPPKVAPRVVASSIVSALKRGLEDVFVGDVAEDIRQRLAANPKAVERELGA